jgi:hypothetical protein
MVCLAVLLAGHWLVNQNQTFRPEIDGGYVLGQGQS